jgi:hypothetical protein
MSDTQEHEHDWGPVQHGWATGTPSRACLVADCRFITLDLYEDTCMECGRTVGVDDTGSVYHVDRTLDADHMPDRSPDDEDEDEVTCA